MSFKSASSYKNRLCIQADGNATVTYLYTTVFYDAAETKTRKSVLHLCFGNGALEQPFAKVLLPKLALAASIWGQLQGDVQNK